MRQGFPKDLDSESLSLRIPSLRIDRASVCVGVLGVGEEGVGVRGPPEEEGLRRQRLTSP